MSSLPVWDAGGPAVRADAAANRARILCAAERLFAERGPDCVSMDQIAAAAGVGKGTLFRRFGDRASLAHALLDERERRFQDELIRGAPPLGPGAPPAVRLEAFGHALLELVEEQGELLRAAEAGGRRAMTSVYAVYRAHVAALLAALDPRLDREVLPDLLLAGLSAELVLHLRRERGLAPADLRAGWTDLVGRVCAPALGDGCPG
jgi:AcrR family transcriptional regulator